MTDLPPPPSAAPLPPLPAPPLDGAVEPIARRAGPVISTVIVWNVIVAVCLLLPVLRAERKAAVTPATRPVATQATAPRPAVDLPTKLAGRYILGTARLLPKGTATTDLLQSMPDNSPEARIAAAIVAGEIIGPDEARRRLDEIDDPDARTFRTVYANPPVTTPTATSLPATAPARNLSSLHARFDWFARLAESYGRPDSDPQRADVLAAATRTMVTIVGAGVVVGAAVISGLVLFNTAIVMVVLGRLKFSTPRPVGKAHVYGESSAIYLGGFIVASLLVGLVAALFGLGQSLAVQLAGLGVVVLIATAWPLLRGVPWRVLRRDWGIHGGRNPAIEVGAGLVGYLAGLPVLFAGAAITALLMRIGQTQASHPITNEIGGTPAWQLYLMASVFAPLTEELLFRGAMVSHLRATLGVVMSAVISGVVFAAVHPQGWAAVPVLGSIGAVLALIRLWRGSLIASITAHAINNTFVVTLLVLATG